MRTLPSSIAVALEAAMLFAGCGGQPAQPPAAAESATVACPPPIGRVPKEDCGEAAAEFGALSVSGALKVAGSTKDAELRTTAIRAAAGLANALKEARLELCESYDKCLVSPKDRDDRDKKLRDLMAQVTKLWNGRRFVQPDDSQRFASAVGALRAELDKLEGKSAPTPPPAAAAPPRITLHGDALSRIDGAGIAFSLAAGSITVTTSDGSPHDVLTTRPETLSLLPGKRFELEVEGSYAPSAAPLITAGQELVARVKYRATKAGELSIALRTLEEPDLPDAGQTFHFAADEKGSHEATLSPPPGGSGFYVAIGVRGGACDLDDVEIASAGKSLATARAESAEEPYLKTACTLSATRPIAGRKSFHCEGASASSPDVLTLGAPDAYLFLAVRTPSGETTRVKTLSLEGGRNIDASLTEAGALVIGMVGRGTATIRAVSANEIAR